MSAAPKQLHAIRYVTPKKARTMFAGHLGVRASNKTLTGLSALGRFSFIERRPT
jgi:hypothetical protein